VSAPQKIIACFDFIRLYAVVKVLERLVGETARGAISFDASARTDESATNTL